MLFGQGEAETCAMQTREACSRQFAPEGSCLGLEEREMLCGLGSAMAHGSASCGPANSSRGPCAAVIGGQAELRASRKLDRPSAHFV